MKTKTTLLIILLTSLFKLHAKVDTIYVNIKAIGSNTGTSWVDAYNYLGDALKTAKYGDQVWVAKGIYSAKQSDPLEIHTSIKIYGGFLGNEKSIEQKDPVLNPTILERSSSTGFLYRANVLFVENTDTTAVLDGFTIRNGIAYIKIPIDPNPNDTINCSNNPYNFRACQGGGIFMQSTSVNKPVFLNIYNSIFINNYAVSGGAISVDSYLGNGGLNINNCEFYNNNGAEDSGAILMTYGPDNLFNTKIINTIFNGNGAFDLIGAVNYVSKSPISNFLIENTKFINNLSSNFSCGALNSNSLNKNGTIIKNCLFINNAGNATKIFHAYGGAFTGSYSKFINCRFTNNSAWEGGAIYGYSNSYINCIFDHNKAGNWGGAILIGGYKIPDSNLILNCTFYLNTSNNFGGAIYNYFSQDINVYNSIFYKNKATNSGNIIATYKSFDPKVNLSNILADESIIDSIVINGGNAQITIDTMSLINSDPIFWESDYDDFRIAGCSKAIDAGSDKWTNAYNLTTDYENGPRIKGKNPDLGAYEMDRFLSFDTLITNATTKKTKDGAIQLYNFKGFKPPLDFTWSNGKKDSSIANLLPGVYLVYIEDSLKCHNTYSLTVESPNQTKSTESLTSILISPNLTKIHSKQPVLTLNSSKTQQLKLSLTNNEGKLLMQEQWNIQTGINSRNLPNDIPGIYYVALENEEYERVVLKYIVD